MARAGRREGCFLLLLRQISASLPPSPHPTVSSSFPLASRLHRMIVTGFHSPRFIGLVLWPIVKGKQIRYLINSWQRLREASHLHQHSRCLGFCTQDKHRLSLRQDGAPPECCLVAEGKKQLQTLVMPLQAQYILISGAEQQMTPAPLS